ncbi:MAG: FkbM family methyltransferase [Alphaproteobacteria bacterium]|nr:FkbM family methyltransferase [Alphaproteobacteria bacterium]
MTGPDAGLRRDHSGAPIGLFSCRHGVLFTLRSDVFSGRAIEVYGEFSEIEAAFLMSLLWPGATALDIGANLGTLTIPLARAVGERGRVLAFEPQTFLYRILRANVAVNNLAGIVSPYHLAVGEAASRIDAPIFDYAAVNNFGGFDISLKAFSNQPIRPLPWDTVPQVAVDDLGLPACDLIKINVEGMEADVVAGAARTIARFRPMLYLEAHGPIPRLLTELQSLGYRAWWHHPPLFNPANFRGVRENLWGDLRSHNVVLAPSEAARMSVILSRNDLVPILDPFAVPGQSRSAPAGG